MGLKFWLKRAVLIYLGLFVIFFVVEMIKQHTVAAGLEFSTTWALITTVVFISARLYQSRRGAHCAMCDDVAVSKEDKE